MRFYTKEAVSLRVRFWGFVLVANILASAAAALYWGVKGGGSIAAVYAWAIAVIIVLFLYVRYANSFALVKGSFPVREGRVIGEYITDSLYVKKTVCEKTGIRFEELLLEAEEVCKTITFACTGRVARCAISLSVIPDVEQLQVYYDAFMGEQAHDKKAAVEDALEYFLEHGSAGFLRSYETFVKRSFLWPYAEQHMKDTLGLYGLSLGYFKCEGEAFESKIE